MENAVVNGVELRARRVDLLRDGPVATAPTVAANLVRPPLAHVGVSGLLHADVDGIAAAFGRLGLRERAASQR